MWSVLLDWKWIGTDLSTSVHLYDAYFLVHLGSNRPIPTVSNLFHVASRAYHVQNISVKKKPWTIPWIPVHYHGHYLGHYPGHYPGNYDGHYPVNQVAPTFLNPRATSRVLNRTKGYLTHRPFLPVGHCQVGSWPESYCDR